MSDLLQEALTFMVKVGATILDTLVLVISFVFNSLFIMYTEMPVAFGLMAGVLFTWMFLRRDRHPVLKMLTAPLKLVVDILDLAWDQAVELATDAWDTAYGWAKRPFGWTKAQLKKAYDIVVKGLSLIKMKFKKKD